ncbi:uncharacterized protein J3R85_006362 [Psidium guajava]|nr:uncharacterized protein J3R85_006362 [Psidium guajava]
MEISYDVLDATNSYPVECFYKCGFISYVIVECRLSHVLNYL